MGYALGEDDMRSPFRDRAFRIAREHCVKVEVVLRSEGAPVAKGIWVEDRRRDDGALKDVWVHNLACDTAGDFNPWNLSTVNAGTQPEHWSVVNSVHNDQRYEDLRSIRQGLE
jgi:hypothetical protein